MKRCLANAQVNDSGNLFGLSCGGLDGGLLSLGLDGLVLLYGSLVSVVAVARGPEGKVVTQKLHDEGRIPVALFTQGVELGDRIVEGLLGQVASAVGGVEDLVVEHGEVQRKTETDGVSRGQLGLCNVGGVLETYVSSEGSCDRETGMPTL